ncbi:MAG TPA: hypothetical protein VIR27_09580 [Mycobacteriales bacterium]|jgi:hypothetical protein
MRALRAEFTKLFTTRLWLWLILVVVAITGSLVALIITTAVDPSSVSDPEAEVVAFTVNLSPIAYLVSVITGIIGITGEFRHQTITPTVLSTPHRPVAVAAKLLVHLLFGALLGAIFVFVLAGTGAVLLAGQDISVSLSDPTVMHAMWGSVLVCGLFGVLGIGIGTLLRNQVAAVVTVVLYLLMVENILLTIRHVRDAYPYLPGGAARGLLLDGGTSLAGGDLLGSGQATLVLAVWALGLALLGSFLTLGRDIS